MSHLSQASDVFGDILDREDDGRFDLDDIAVWAFNCYQDPLTTLGSFLDAISQQRCRRLAGFALHQLYSQH